MRVVVLTVDQHGSQTRPDQVPEAIEALALVPTRLAFERTAGDEFQGVLDDPQSVVAALELLLRANAWNIGIGVGDVETPLPDLARAGRGPAYVAARAVGPTDAARALESAVWLWAALLARRTPRGWEVADLVDQGLTYDETASRIGISQSAVSQRAAAAGIAEGRRARELVAFLTWTALEGT